VDGEGNPTARLGAALAPAAAVGVALALWQLSTVFVHSAFFPSPLEVGRTFARLAVQGDIQDRLLAEHAWVSLVRVLKGFAVAAALAVPLGIAFGLWDRLYRLAKGIVEPVRFIPPLGWVPLAIIFLSGDGRYTFIIALGAFFPILVTTMAGVHAMDVRLVEVAQVLGATRAQVVAKVVLPAALPSIVAGARLGIGVGWACIVAAEMIGGESVGLGRLIVSYGELLQIDAVVVGMITIGALGYALNELFLLLERRAFPWRREVRV